jgi:hypothetical protein
VRRLALVLLAFIILPGARAQEAGLDEEQRRTLERVLIQLETLDSLDATDQIRARKTLLLAEASQVTSGALTSTDQVRTLVASGPADRSYFDFLDVLWVFVGLTITVAVLGLAGLYLSPLLRRLPREVVEALGWASSLLAILGAPRLVTPIVAFIAAILGLVMFLPLSAYRTWDRTPRATFFVWAVALGLAAVVHGSRFFGTLTVLALLSCVGACLLPVLDELFTRRKVVRSAFAASGLLLAGGAALGLTQDPPWFQLFEAAIFWLAGTTFASALLTLSSRHYQKTVGVEFLCWQVVSVAAGVVALYVGHVLEARLDSAVLQEVGGTFLALFFVEKVSDLPWRARHWPWIALAVGLGGFWAVRFASQYPQFFLGF